MSRSFFVKASDFLSQASEATRQAELLQLGLDYAAKLVGATCALGLAAAAKTAHSFGATQESFLHVAMLAYQATAQKRGG